MMQNVIPEIIISIPGANDKKMPEKTLTVSMLKRVFLRICQTLKSNYQRSNPSKYGV